MSGYGSEETSRRCWPAKDIVDGLGTSLPLGRKVCLGIGKRRKGPCSSWTGWGRFYRLAERLSRAPARGVASNVGSHSFQLILRSQDDVVKPCLPVEIPALQIPPDSFRRLGFETSDRGSQGLREQTLRIFRRVRRRNALEDQNAMHVIGHDDPFVQGNPGLADWDLQPFVSDDCT